MRARFLYAACTDAHLDATYVYTYVRKYVCVLCMLFLSGTPHGLSSRSTGQWLAASTALFRSTPLRTAPPVPFVPRQPAPSSHLRSVSTSSSSLLRVIQCLASLGSFVLSFVRSCYSCPRAARRFGDFNARQLLFSRLLSPSLSVSFRSSVPAPTRVRTPARSSLFRGSVPSSFQSGTFPRLTGIFGATPFGYR